MDIVKLKEKYGEEKVLVVKSELIPKELNDKPFSDYDALVFNILVNNSEFVYRYLAEGNPKYRQLIPYIICGVNGKFFGTRRLAKSGEPRLINNIALGIGGHINPEDAKHKFGVIIGAVERELKEEIIIPAHSSFELHYIGFINDTSNEVGKDHLGIVFVANIRTSFGEVEVKETDKLEAVILDYDSLSENYDSLENWSKIIYDYALKKQ